MFFRLLFFLDFHTANKFSICISIYIWSNWLSIYNKRFLLQPWNVSTAMNICPGRKNNYFHSLQWDYLDLMTASTEQCTLKSEIVLIQNDWISRKLLNFCEENSRRPAIFNSDSEFRAGHLFPHFQVWTFSTKWL